jgi:hypothetical protein
MLLVFVAQAEAEDPPAPPSPARQCADAAAGSEVEVCLQLAAANPDAVDGIAAALRAHIDRGSADDRDILQALLLLLSDDQGVVGARQLGLLHDPRAVAPLVHAARTREPEVALEAVAALARYEEGLEPLASFLLDSDLPIEVRAASARALGDLGGDEAGDVLLSTLRRRSLPVAVRTALIDTLETRFADRKDEIDRPVSRDGSVWLAAGTGVGLGYTLYATGSFGQANLSLYGASAGGLAGGTAGYLAGRAWPLEAGDAAFITTTGTTGVVAGNLIGASIDPRPATEASRTGLLGGLVGGAVGYGLGWGLAPGDPGGPVDQVEATTLAAATAVGAAALFTPRDDVPVTERPPRGKTPELAAGIGLVVGGITGHLVAPRVDLTLGDGGTIVLASSYGLLAGALVPPSADRRRWPLPITGLCVGGLVGYGVSGIIDPRPDVLVGGTAGLGAGTAFGLGLGLLADPHQIHNGPATGALVGGTVGVGLGAYAAWKNPHAPEASDVTLGGVATGWAAWQAIGWGRVVNGDNGRSGFNFMVPAAAGAVTAGASPYLDIPVTSSLAAASLGVWGGYVAGVAGRLGDQNVLVFALLGSDAGLGAGALAESSLIGTPPLVIGLADAGGALGGSTAALGASFVTDDPDLILGTSLAGAGVGFVGGAWFGTSLRGRTHDIALAMPRIDVPGTWTLAPAAFATPEGPRYGARLEVHGW